MGVMNYIFYGINFVISIVSVSIPDKLTDTVNLIKQLWGRKMGKNQKAIHWAELTEQQIEAFLNEAIAKKDFELAQHFRYIKYLKMLNNKQQV
ncbi:MAG: hypothetical protein EZS28_009882 [Streblomastix strix]|uniref:Uncharacterized protein n=1 Tax=Streblomastix strix TaxID=222440 RepID=A0A5J4WIA0_9EUKA|nr:MAG: hypothetical protein EZS28_009882 [Streblomastix strix]